MNCRKDYIERNYISFEKLNLMDKNQCVKVSVSFIYNIICRCAILEKIDENVKMILKKHLDVITMEEIIGEKNCSYCLMKVCDILFILSILDINSYSKGKILVSNVSCSFEEYYIKLKEKYLEKRIGINLEVNTSDECNVTRKRTK